MEHKSSVFRGCKLLFCSGEGKLLIAKGYRRMCFCLSYGAVWLETFLLVILKKRFFSLQLDVVFAHEAETEALVSAAK